jgi:hypothetical protein
MKYMVCLLFALAIGCGSYAAGAVIWAAVDPQGAGISLLFTIPVAITAAAVPALLGVMLLINRCDWGWGMRRAKRPRKVQSKPQAVRAEYEDLELTFA